MEEKSNLIEVHCKYCNSTHVIKKGFNYNKQQYQCKDCKKYFRIGDNRIKRDIRQKELALLLYSHNTSIRSIQSVLNKYFDTKIGFNVIDNWIKSSYKLLNYDIKRLKNISDSDSDNNIGINNTNTNFNTSSNNINNDIINNNDSSINNNSISNNNTNIKNSYDNSNSNDIITANRNKPKTIEVLELDELYTYFYDLKKNKEKMSKYGLLLTETEIKLFHIK